MTLLDDARGSHPVSPGKRARNAHRQVMVLSGGLAFGVVTFVGIVAFMVLGGGLDPISPLPPAIVWGMAGAGLLALAAGRIVGPRLREAPRSADAATVATRWVNGSVVAAALAEVPGMLGGVIGLLNGDLVLAGGLAAVSLVAILTGIPSREALEQRLRRLTM